MSRRGWCLLALAVGAVDCTRLRAEIDPIGDASDDVVDASEDPLTVDTTLPTGVDHHHADADTDADACESTCVAGSLRCSATGSIERCTRPGRCLSWNEVAQAEQCSKETMCCDGTCTPINGSNCFACGNQCKDDKPVCSSTLKGCGCEVDQDCAMRAEVCDTAQHHCVPTDFSKRILYVKSGAASGGEGGVGSEFATITEALNARSPGEPTTIVVAKGTYQNESFPIAVTGGVWLKGAGSGETLIFGTSDNYLQGSSVSMRIGDTGLVNKVSGFTLRPNVTTLWGGWQAVECTAGNATDDGKAAPNTILDDLVVHAEFSVGIIESAGSKADAPASSGCNLSLLHSKIQASALSILATGCYVAPVPIGLQAEENTFLPGGISISACVASATIRKNTFDAGAIGIAIGQPLLPSGKKNHFIIQGNTFRHLSQAGINLAGGSITVDDLSGNVFTDVTAPNGSGFIGTGLLVEGRNEPGLARIENARGNRFFDNDIGLKILSIYEASSGFVAADFGTATQHGNNVFRCNSQKVSNGGGDVIVDLNVSNLTTPTTLPFVGNTWDHSSPTYAYLSNRKNGTDYTLPDNMDAGDKILLDVTPTTDPPDEDCPRTE